MGDIYKFIMAVKDFRNYCIEHPNKEDIQKTLNNFKVITKKIVLPESLMKFQNYLNRKKYGENS